MSFNSPLFFIYFIAILGLIYFLWIAGFFGIWKHGSKDISEDAGDIFAQTYPVVKINFEKTEGKVIYEEENNKIYVSEVFIDTNLNYQVILRN